MTARSMMRMRALVEYNATTGWDSFNQPQAPTWTTSGTVAVYVWPKIASEVVNASPGYKNVIVQSWGCLWPRSSGISDEQRFGSIQDRLGRTIYGGPLEIETITVYDRSHLTLLLSRKSSGDDVDLA